MAKVTDTTPISLNAQLNLWSADGKIQFEKDKEAARQFFLQEVNPTTQFFYTLEEKLSYLFDNEYYEKEIWDQYDFADVKGLYKFVYGFKHRFESYFSAFKYDRHRNRAAVALANKLARITWALWKHERSFDGNHLSTAA